MRRLLLALALVAVSLSACGNSGDTTVDPPPQATAISSPSAIESPQVSQIVTQWQSAAPAQFKADAVKPETIDEKIYTTTASLKQVQDHYDALVGKGWHALKRMTNTGNDQVLLLGFEHGTTALVVGAVDASKFGGKGVIVYTLKGTK